MSELVTLQTEFARKRFEDAATQRQGACGTRAQGRRRDGGADQGACRQDVQESPSDRSARTRLRRLAGAAFYCTTITAPRARRGASRRIAAAGMATQPAVGERSARAMWKKIALPRALGAAREILVEHEGQIVERVFAPHAVGGVARGRAHRAVVVAARRVFAPALIAPQRPQRHAAGGGRGRSGRK